MVSQNCIERAREDGEPIDDGLIWETVELDDAIVQFPGEGNEWRMDKTEEVYSRLPEDAPYPEMDRVSNGSKEGLVYEKVGEGSLKDLERELERLEEGTIEYDQKRHQYLDLVQPAGEALANLHSGEGEGYGEPVINEWTEERNYDSWKEYVQDQIESIEDETADSPFEEATDRALDEFDIDNLPENPGPRVLHADYSSDNLMFEDGSVAVIDFDNAVYGDPDFGFVRSQFQLCDNEEEAERFREGYESVRELDMSDEMERNYKALAIAMNAKAGVWCAENREDSGINISGWAEGLRNYAENQL